MVSVPAIFFILTVPVALGIAAVDVATLFLVTRAIRRWIDFPLIRFFDEMRRSPVNSTARATGELWRRLGVRVPTTQRGQLAVALVTLAAARLLWCVLLNVVNTR
jgi:hypothetical protein